MYLKNIDSNLSIYLNICRGLAATLVLAVHLRGFFFDTYNNLNPDSQNIINYVLFFITRLGHESVMIFFVLSGYLVGGNYLTDVINRQADWKKYFLDRITRMWIVLIPALLIGFILDYYRCNYLTDCYQVSNWSNSVFAGNLFFLQTISVPTFTSNVALWSLANEFWYYLIFPLLLIPFQMKLNIVVRLIISSITLLIFYKLMPGIIELLPVWLMGVGIRFIKTPLINNKLSLLCIYPLFIAAIYYSNTKPFLFSHYTVGITFCLLLLYYQQNKNFNLHRFNKPAKFLADYSFSIYAFHLPIMFLILAFCRIKMNFGIRYTNAGITQWLIYISLLLTILTILYMFYTLTEKNTYSFRKWLKSKL